MGGAFGKLEANDQKFWGLIFLFAYKNKPLGFLVLTSLPKMLLVNLICAFSSEKNCVEPHLQKDSI